MSIEHYSFFITLGAKSTATLRRGAQRSKRSEARFEKGNFFYKNGINNSAQHIGNNQWCGCDDYNVRNLKDGCYGIFGVRVLCAAKMEMGMYYRPSVHNVSV